MIGEPQCWRQFVRGTFFKPFGNGVYYLRECDLFFSETTQNQKAEKPLSVCVKLWEKCNLRCRVCVAWNGKDSRRFLAEGISRILEALCEYAPLRLVLSGGEPTLYPNLHEILQMALETGYSCVVSSNLTCGDPLRSLCRSFVYDVSLYGYDRDSYLRYTGRDLYYDFVRSFESVLSSGHIVVANIRVDHRWHDYLPGLMKWIEDFPVRKLRISNTLPGGRNIDAAKPLGSRECEELTAYMRDLRVDFPVVLPTPESRRRIHSGYIVIDPPCTGQAVAHVNGCPVQTTQELHLAVRAHSVQNRNLFTMQNYLWPSQEA